MAKSAYQRHQVNRLVSKWTKELKHTDHNMDMSVLNFGRIFSKDPMDCGNPKCGLCSGNKRIKQNKIDRHHTRQDIQSQHLDLNSLEDM